MLFHSSRRSLTKLIVLAAVVTAGIVCALGGFARRDLVEASSSGPPPSHTNAPLENNCTECHTSFPVNSGTGGVTINGLPARYSPGQQVPVTVTVSQSDAVIYGFQMTVIDSSGGPAGSYTLPSQTPAKMQVLPGLVNGVVRQYVEHTIDGITPTQFGSLSWTFTWNAPNGNIGPVHFYAAGNAANSDGSSSGDYIYTTSKLVLPRQPVSQFDFDGDNKTDIGIYRSNGANGAEWWVQKSGNNQVFALQFGVGTDTPVPADFTGDGKADIAFWRPSDGQWFVLRSEDFSFFAFPFGGPGDIPAPADYDGDGKADAAVFRPSTNTWFIQRSSGGTSIIQFGAAGDKPVPGDYDGDGKADIAIFRPAGASGGAEWWIQRSTAGLIAVQFGSSTDKAVPGDYTGDGKTDIAFWRPTDGQWFILRSENFSFFAFPFGGPGDVPAPGDYDGDGRWDAGVFRPSASTFFVNRTTAGTLIQQFGVATDRPIPNSFVRN